MGAINIELYILFNALALRYSPNLKGNTEFPKYPIIVEKNKLLISKLFIGLSKIFHLKDLTKTLKIIINIDKNINGQLTNPNTSNKSLKLNLPNAIYSPKRLTKNPNNFFFILFS